MNNHWYNLIVFYNWKILTSHSVLDCWCPHTFPALPSPHSLFLKHSQLTTPSTYLTCDDTYPALLYKHRASWENYWGMPDSHKTVSLLFWDIYSLFYLVEYTPNIITKPSQARLWFQPKPNCYGWKNKNILFKQK